MKAYSISQLARAFGLSRSTLLYYDRIGLLYASQRSGAGYRIYSEEDRRRLERICMYRELGVPLADVKQLLEDDEAPAVKVLEERLRALSRQILHLKSQQHLIVAMLKKMKCETYTPVVDKEMWVKMLEAAGMDEASMAKWHAEFESRAPVAHYEMLLSLGISERDARQIRKWAGKMATA